MQIFVNEKYQVILRIFDDHGNAHEHPAVSVKTAYSQYDFVPSDKKEHACITVFDFGVTEDNGVGFHGLVYNHKDRNNGEGIKSSPIQYMTFSNGAIWGFDVLRFQNSEEVEGALLTPDNQVITIARTVGGDSYVLIHKGNVTALNGYKLYFVPEHIAMVGDKDLHLCGMLISNRSGAVRHNVTSEAIREFTAANGRVYYPVQTKLMKGPFSDCDRIICGHQLTAGKIEAAKPQAGNSNSGWFRECWKRLWGKGPANTK